jgi:diguanylate cyclase (GGDEF)-like protein
MAHRGAQPGRAACRSGGIDPSSASLARPDRSDLVIGACSVALLGAAGGVVWWAQRDLFGSAAQPLAWLVIALAYLAAELFVVNVPRGRETQAFSLTEVALALGLVGAGPVGLLLVRSGVVTATCVVHRKAPVKLLFNVASGAAEVAAAVVVYELVRDGASTGPQVWLAILAAALVAHVLASHLVLAVISYKTWQWDAAAYRSTLALGTLGAVANACLGVVTVIVISTHALGLVALAVVAAVLVVAYRAAMDLRRRHANLGLLYDAIGRFEHTDTQLVAVATTAAEQAARIVQAERASVVVWSVADGEVQVDVGPSLGAWRHRLGSDAATLIARSSAPEGVRDAIVVPLPVRAPRRAALVVADRENRATEFSEDDVRLLEAFAIHTATEIDTAELVDALRTEGERRARQALMDATTGLPNRRWVNEHLADHRDRAVAVVAIDVDHLDAVSDTLGASATDRLIGIVAERLTQTAGGHDCTVARVGGRSFAVVMTSDDADELSVRIDEVVTRVLAAGSDRIEIAELAMSLDLRVGVAIADKTVDPPVMQRALAAARRARVGGTQVEHYEQAAFDAAKRRMLVADALPRAIDAGEIVPWFQPKVEIVTGRVVGFEALARWDSPSLGRVTPDEFVPVAEVTGTIFDLTLVMLRASLAACARWRATGDEMSVAVNLSPITLLDDRLEAAVIAAVHAAGVRPEDLTLEITESVLVEDRERMVPCLVRLRGLGCSISIDDFGTGYSSLSYLGSLPVDEVKLDRSFLRQLATNATDRDIVEAVVDLAHRIGLTVVAEGVETDDVLDCLRAAGCDVAQGYLLGRPAPSAVVLDQASSRRT